MGLFTKLADQYDLKCSVCGKTIQPNEFICIIGKVPKKSYNGLTVPLINKFVQKTGGKMLCESCFHKEYKSVNGS